MYQVSQGYGFLPSSCLSPPEGSQCCPSPRGFRRERFSCKTGPAQPSPQWGCLERLPGSLESLIGSAVRREVGTGRDVRTPVCSAAPPASAQLHGENSTHVQ